MEEAAHARRVHEQQEPAQLRLQGVNTRLADFRERSRKERIAKQSLGDHMVRFEDTAAVSNAGGFREYLDEAAAGPAVQSRGSLLARSITSMAPPSHSSHHVDDRPVIKGHVTG